jgi:hypothetical protein
MSASLKPTLGDAVSVSQNEKLGRLASEAWQKWPASSAGSARRDYIAAGLKLEATWALVEQYQPQVLTYAIGCLLNREKQRLAGEGKKPNSDTGLKPVGGGQALHATQTASAPATPSRDHARPQAERGSEPAKLPTTPITGSPAAPTAQDQAQAKAEAKQAQLKILADKQSARGAVSVQVAIKWSRLDTVLVFGKKIGVCTVAEVKEWIGIREQEKRDAGRDVLFAQNLVANLPSNAIIRDWWTSGDEVDAMYARAEAEHAA